MGNNSDVVITDTDRLLLQKDEEVTHVLSYCDNIVILYFKQDNQILITYT